MGDHANTKSEPANVQVSPEELAAVIAAISTEVDGGESEPHRRTAEAEEPRRARKRGLLREGTVTATGVIGGEVTRRQIADARMRETVLDVAKRVMSKKAKRMTDEQILRKLADEPGFRRSIAGHLHERLDADNVRRLAALRKKLGMSAGPTIELFPEHNRPGLDGFYVGAEEGGPKWLQHKLTNLRQQLVKAADKASPEDRASIELVTGRGTKVSKEAAERVHSVREASNSVKEIRGFIDKAADPSKVNAAGANAAKKMTARAGGAAAGVGAAISLACDAKGLIRGEKSAGEVAENAAWASSEAAMSTVLSASATAGAAPALAAATTALAGSSLAGTTLMAAAVATTGPFAVGAAVSIGVGIGVKQLRKATRG